MRDYFEGWQDKNAVPIPKTRRNGFVEPVIIRKPIEPVRRRTPDSYSGEDATVLITPEKESGAYIKRLKTGEEVKVKKEGFIIGKSSEVDYVIKDNPTVSRRHAEISYTEDGYYLKDLGSSNHVFVAGKCITEPVKLANSVVFRLSEDEEFEFMVRTGQ